MTRGLRRGDRVEVLSAADILETLDQDGTLNAMPFMPEMVAYCGRRFTVDRRAEKVCDTINSNLQSRQLPNTVLLEELRCDGSAHGGCQAECRYYWNEAWLRRVDPQDPPDPRAQEPAAVDALRARLEAHTTRASDGANRRFRCQATEMVTASVPLSTANPRAYLRELTTGNVPAKTFVKVMSRAAVMQSLDHFGRLPSPPLKGATSKSPSAAPLGLQPGEWVRVKSREQVQEMLTDKGTNRGLWFDREMMAFCGQLFQVHSRVTRIIDERTGEMIELASDCITLESAFCSGELSTGRWFCPREIYPYWREAWLERVEGPVTSSAGATSPTAVTGTTS